MPKIQLISVTAFLSYCIIVGTLIFSRGFLLNRQVIHEVAGPCQNRNVHIKGNNNDNNKDNNGSTRPSSTPPKDLLSMANWCNPLPPFNKVILLLVDALRHDFVDRMDFLSSVTTRRNRGNVSGSGSSSTSTCSYKFIADPPTTTMQRLKALMTGTMPTFIDASANFNSYEIEDDSLIYQLHSAGKKIAFLGDDTWLSLFPEKYFKSPFVEAHPSFNAWDLDTVDRAVNKTIHTIFPSGDFSKSNDQWDVLIAHLLGVDHCGHRYGPNHPEMTRKLNETDALIKHVFNAMNSNTLLVVFGDHGMTSTGDHGGDSKDEVESAVIFLAKQFSKYNTPFQCGEPMSSHISQIDMVPTLAPLLGIPIPYSNIGQMIPSFLPTKVQADAIAANAAQVKKYVEHFPSIYSYKTTSFEEDGQEEELTLPQQYEKIEEAFYAYQSSPSVANRERFQKLSGRFLSQIKEAAVFTWTQFNVPMIYTGVTVTLLSVTSAFIYLSTVTRRNSVSVYSVFMWLWPSLAHWSVLCSFAYHSISSTGLLGIVVSTLSGVIVFLIIFVYKWVGRVKRIIFYRNWSLCVQSVSTLCSFLVYIFTCLAVFSNSFIINEGLVLGFTLSFVTLLQVVCTKWQERCTPHQNPTPIPTSSSSSSSSSSDSPFQITQVKKLLKCSWGCYFVLLTLVRMSAIFFRCREEQTTCTEEFLLHKQLSSLPDDWLVHKCLRYGVSLLVLAIFVVSLRYWLIYRSCTFSRKPRAMISRFVPSVLVVLLGVFWALQGLPYISANASKIPLLMNYLPLLYQGLTISAILLVIVKPICCVGRLEQLPFQNPKTALGTLPSFTTPNTTLSGQSTQKNGIINHKQPNGHTSPPSRGKLPPSKSLNGVLPSKNLVNERSYNSSTTLPYYMIRNILCPCSSEDTYSSTILTLSVLVTLLLVQVTSTGVAPALVMEAYVLVCLVGIFRKSWKSGAGTWMAAISWTLTSQYFFYATGHQPIFSAIPWDSAFIGGADNSLTSTSSAWIAWARAGLAVVGNLHVSQILSSFALPLLVYWRADPDHVESLMGPSEGQRTFLLYGKVMALHGLKLLMCMCCAGWHRRHLMVWKIFAPKFIFEAVSFIVTSSTSLIVMVIVSRIHYCHQRCAMNNVKQS